MNTHRNTRTTPYSRAEIVRSILCKARLSRDPPEPVRRYERDHPGELIHIDIKKLDRFDRVGHRITGDRTG